MVKPISWKKILIYSVTEGPLVYLGLAIFSLRRILINPLTLGRKFDWSLPLFNLKPLLGEALYSWSRQNTGAPAGYYSAWLGDLIYGIFGYLGIRPTIFIPLFLILVLTFAGWGMARLARSIHIPWPLAMLGGLFYMLTPTVYIRLIIGFTLWLLAYALAPWILLLYLKTIHQKKWLRTALLTGVLVALASAQIQFAVMIGFILIVACLTKGYGLNFKNRLVRLATVFSVAIALHLPWLLALVSRNLGQDIAFFASGSAVLKSVTDLPHSFRRTLFLNEHHITAALFDQKNAEPINLIVNLALIAIIFGGLFIFWKKINLRWIILASLILGLKITLLPHEDFVWFYEKIFNASKLINLFREVYHGQFLSAFGYSLAIASVSAAVWRLVRRRSVKFGFFLLMLVLVIIFDQTMLGGNFGEYGSRDRLSPEYRQFYRSINQKNKAETRAWYPSGLGFVQAKDDPFGASNDDVIARSLGLSKIDEGSSNLNLPSNVAAIRNTMIHSLKQSEKIDEYLNKLGASFVIDRRDYLSLNVSTSEKSWRQIKVEPSLDLNLWQKEEKFLPLVVYRKNKPLAKIRPARDLSLSFGDLEDLGQSQDILFLSQQSEKGQIIQKLPVLRQYPKEDLIAGLADQKYKINFAAVANRNYQATDGWSQGRFSWWRDRRFAAAEGFVYTQKPDKIFQELKLNSSGFHQVLIRLWYSSSGGILNFAIGDKSIQINTKSDKDEWRWLQIDDVVISGNHREALAEAISGDQAVGEIVFLPIYELERLSAQIEKLKTTTAKISQSKPTVESDFISPTKYQVKVKNDQPFLLILAEGFDRHWRLKIAGQKIEPIIVNGWANGFWLDRAYLNQTGTIYYQPQTWYLIGLLISFLTLISIAALTVYLKYFKKRMLNRVG